MSYKYVERMYKKHKGQHFGRPKLKKCGKEIDIYGMIQAGRDDTEIYPTLEKYGCLDRMTVDDKEIYGDLTELTKGGLRGLINREQKTQELWESLPIEYRNEFQNNKALFLENGEKWLKDRIEKQVKPTEKEQSTGENIKENTDA